MSDLVGNPEDRFSPNAAHLFLDLPMGLSNLMSLKYGCKGLGDASKITLGLRLNCLGDDDKVSFQGFNKALWLFLYLYALLCKPFLAKMYFLNTLQSDIQLNLS